MQFISLTMLLYILEFGALAIGVIGTLLWAMGKNQLAVAILWMVSAILWMVFATFHEHYGLVVAEAFSVALCAVGIRTYFRR